MNLQEIRERCEKATPGPWFVVGPPWRASYPHAGEMTDLLPTYVISGSDDPHAGTPVIDAISIDEWEAGKYHELLSQSDADLEFCAHARTDIPALIDRVEEQDEKIEALEAEAERLVRRDGQWAASCDRLESQLAEAKRERDELRKAVAK